MIRHRDTGGTHQGNYKEGRNIRKPQKINSSQSTKYTESGQSGAGAGSVSQPMIMQNAFFDSRQS